MTALREAAEAALKELESLLTCEMKRMPMFVDQSVVSTLRAALSAPQAEQHEPLGREEAFLRFCTTHCSSGAQRAEWYRTIWNEAWNAALAAPPKRKPLTDDEIWADDGIMAENATAGLMLLDLVHLVRAVERAHGIGGGGE